MFKLRNYTIKARYFPVILTMFPFIVLRYFLLDWKLGWFVNFLSHIKILWSIGYFAVIFYILFLINRTIWKFLFERRFFDNWKDLPTTQALMHQTSSYSHEYIESIWNKVKNDFWLILPSKEECVADLDNSKKRIIEIVSQIRAKVKSGNLLLQHNIEYWFRRNLIWWSPMMIISAWIWAYFLYSKEVIIWFYLMILTIIIWLLLLILSKWLMEVYGEQYSKILFQEYFDCRE